MAGSAFYRGCIREIRQSVYGRESRKPIADAIEDVAGNGTEEINEEAVRLQTALGTVNVTQLQDDYYRLDFVRINGR